MLLRSSKKLCWVQRIGVGGGGISGFLAGFYLQNYPLHGKAAHSGKSKEQVSLIFWSPRLPQSWRRSADQNVRGEVRKLSGTWMVGWSPGGSTRDADPIAAAQRLQGALNCVAPAGTGWAGQLPEEPGGGTHRPPFPAPGPGPRSSR